MLDSKILRFQLQTYNRSDENMHCNFIGYAVKKLALYGIHVCDHNDAVINFILGLLNKQHRHKSIGGINFNGTSNHSIGSDKEQNLDITYNNSPFHAFLQKASLHRVNYIQMCKL